MRQLFVECFARLHDSADEMHPVRRYSKYLKHTLYFWSLVSAFTFKKKGLWKPSLEKRAKNGGSTDDGDILITPGITWSDHSPIKEFK